MASAIHKHITERPDRLVGRRELRERFPVTDMSIWRWEQAGLFPMHITIGGRSFWRDSDLRAVERGEWTPVGKADDVAA